MQEIKHAHRKRNMASLPSQAWTQRESWFLIKNGNVRNGFPKYIGTSKVNLHDGMVSNKIVSVRSVLIQKYLQKPENI